MVEIFTKPCREAEIEEQNFYQNVFKHDVDEGKDLEDLETFFLPDEERTLVEKTKAPFRGSFYEPQTSRQSY